MWNKEYIYDRVRRTNLIFIVRVLGGLSHRKPSLAAKKAEAEKASITGRWVTPHATGQWGKCPPKMPTNSGCGRSLSTLKQLAVTQWEPFLLWVFWMGQGHIQRVSVALLPHFPPFPPSGPAFLPVHALLCITFSGNQLTTAMTSCSAASLMKWALLQPAAPVMFPGHSQCQSAPNHSCVKPSLCFLCCLPQ